MSGKGEDITFISRKFTLPNTLAEETEEYVYDHYAGNWSQFLRASIKDHVRTLEGNDEFTVKQVQATLEDLKEKVDELRDTIEESDNSQLVQTTPNPNEIPATESSETFGNTTVQREVHQCLLTTDSGTLTLAELNDCIDADPMDVQAALEKLLDKEFIEAETSKQNTRYQIAKPTV